MSKIKINNQYPLVTVLMPVYNGERYLIQAINCILDQTFNNFELLIIDDGSTDRTCEIIRTFQDPRIRFIQNSKNLGLTKTLKMGMNLARGKYIARIDADDYCDIDRLTKQVSFLHKHEEVDVVGSWIYVVDNEGNIVGKKSPPINDVEIKWDLIFDNPLAHSSILFKKIKIQKLGGYDPNYRVGQDYELWTRIMSDTVFAIIPDYLTYIRKHESNISKTYSFDQHYNWISMSARTMSKITGKTVDQETAKRIIFSNIHSSYNQYKEDICTLFSIYSNFTKKYHADGDIKRNIQKNIFTIIINISSNFFSDSNFRHFFIIFFTIIKKCQCYFFERKKY